MFQNTPPKTDKIPYLSLASITLILSLGISYYDLVQAQQLDSIYPTNNPIKIAQSSNSEKKVRIAVLDFDYSSVGNPYFLSYIVISIKFETNYFYYDRLWVEKNVPFLLVSKYQGLGNCLLLYFLRQ